MKAGCQRIQRRVSDCRRSRHCWPADRAPRADATHYGPHADWRAELVSRAAPPPFQFEDGLQALLALLAELIGVALPEEIPEENKPPKHGTVTGIQPSRVISGFHHRDSEAFGYGKGPGTG